MIVDETDAAREVVNLIARLQARGITLAAAGDRLRLSAPKDALTPELRDEVQRAKPALLAWLQASTAASEAAASFVVTRVAGDGPFELAVAQERVWFLHQLDPSSSAYHVGGALRMTGRFVSDAFERAWTEIAQRHDALRTVFTTVDGRPMMRLLPSAAPAIERDDLSAIPAAEREPAAMAAAQAFLARPFDIERGPLWRVAVLRTAADDHIVVLSMHHLISDGWSLAILSTEFTQLYAAYLHNRAAALPPLAVRYVDFASAQRAWLNGPKLEKQFEYWRKQLDGLTVAELPSDRPRGAAGTVPIPEKGRVPLSRALLAGLRELATRERATLFMVMSAAFDVVMARYTGSSDVSLGTPIASRPSADVERVVGMFVNTLVFRTDLSGNPTFRELLRRMRDVSLDAYANQDVSFDRLVSALKPDRDGRPPFFQVLFNVLNAPTVVTRLEGLEISRVPLPPSAAQFDLNVVIDSEQPNDADNALIYTFDGRLFDTETMARLFRHYGRVLDAVLATPDVHIEDIEFLDASERRQMLADWNATARDLPPDATVASLFAQQVAAQPDAVAVVFGDRQATYAELDARSTAIARGLQALELGEERLVGICLQRSIDMVAAVLGVLKAGAAYVPLDPAFPSERLAFMVEDATAAVILSESALLTALPPTSARVVRLDDETDAFWTVAETPAPAPSSPTPRQGDRAYILYTSGSTGRPKGVEIGHRALVNFLLSMAHEPGLTRDDRLLAVTTLSFDIAGLELFLPLITGARIVMAAREQAMDPVQLEALIERHRVTVMQATPATWRMLLDHGWTGSRDLVVLCGGEAMSRDLAGRLVPRVRALWNMYGPTETTIWSTIERVTSGDEAISIGRPIANTQVYVLDQQMRPTPIGVPGELCIGGDGVAFGYFRRPELTASRFVPDPFSARPDARMYRTGDLARFRADGRLDCLGRLDNQVKVRGFRIELGDVEACLAAHPGVKQVAAVVREDRGEAALAAYVVSADAADPVSTDALREHARTHLPPYMVPTAIVLLAALPLTPNGKVDRKALPAPEASARTIAQPANDVEREIAAIWAEVLNRPTVPVDENFFDLGGHSLLLAQVQRRIDDRLHRQVSMLDLLQFPTVRGLAASLDAVKAAPAPASAARDRMDRLRQALGRQRAGRLQPGESQ